MKRSVLTIIGIAAVLIMSLLAVFLSGNPNSQNPQAPEQTNSSGSQSSGPKVQSEVKVFYISLGNVTNSDIRVGCNDGLVERRVLIEGLKNDIHEAYKQQLALGNATEPGLYNALTRSTLKVEAIRVENRTAYVELSGQLVSGDSCDKARIRSQLEWPALQFDDIDIAVVRLNGFLLEELF